MVLRPWQARSVFLLVQLRPQIGPFNDSATSSTGHRRYREKRRFVRTHEHVCLYVLPVIPRSRGAADSEEFLSALYEELAQYLTHPTHDFEGIRSRNPAKPLWPCGMLAKLLNVAVSFSCEELNRAETYLFWLNKCYSYRNIAQSSHGLAELTI